MPSVQQMDNWDDSHATQAENRQQNEPTTTSFEWTVRLTMDRWIYV